jgi:hypothetical protein
MKIRQVEKYNNLELPLQLFVSFEKVFNHYKEYAEDESHPYYQSAKELTAYLGQYPDLIEGFSDFSLLEKYGEQTDLMLEALFPEILSTNEIKAASIPFSFTTFKFTKRFESILQNAGDNHELFLRGMEDNLMYLHACTMILASVYKYPIDLKRPFFFDIPDKKAGVMKHYRATFNGDFAEITPTENAPKITEDDIKILLDNFDNIEVWKEKFPPNSYIFKGFGIMNLFDVTTDVVMAQISTDLLRSDDDLLVDLERNLREFYNIKDLSIGYSVFDNSSQSLECAGIKKSQSLILTGENISCSNDGFFCDHIIDRVFHKNESVAISDVEVYGANTHKNGFYKQLKTKGIQSILLLPIKAMEGNDLAILEIASPRPFELNSVNQSKLKDLIPVFEASVKRSSEERLNVLEATIQEHYTSIHPTVKWRFYEAAENYQNALLNAEETPIIEDIVFDDVYPLFGQSDIKGSSMARNTAIEEDLTTQLTLAINVLQAAKKKIELPIYDELSFRISEYLDHTKDGLKAGDEVGILQFLKKDIYPVFNHLKASDADLATLVDTYISHLDEDLKVVYVKRKAYENSVMMLNNKLAKYLDKKQEEAQEMYPHYFERYKTDGVEYNMYIGQSLTKDNSFNDLYLYNLRLWQLQNTYEMEQVAHQARKEMDHDLQVASLILVHSNPLAIKFRMDEKQFDVDGAYNIRYEIIKKRIDKAHINGTTERLTVPGKIAIVYSQDKDAREYMKYIKYLQSKKMFGKLEKLELEDLQGVSGLKALRVEVLYQESFCEKSSLTIDELMEEFK